MNESWTKLQKYRNRSFWLQEQRLRPDYCYSDGSNDRAEIPAYCGPWSQGGAVRESPYDSGNLTDTEAIEELIEMEQRDEEFTFT